MSLEKTKDVIWSACRATLVSFNALLVRRATSPQALWGLKGIWSACRRQDAGARALRMYLKPLPFVVGKIPVECLDGGCKSSEE